MGDAAEAPWEGTAPLYRPPDARSEWEDAVEREGDEPFTVLQGGRSRVTALRAEVALEEVARTRAAQALAVRRRLDRATARAARAVQRREAAQQREGARTEAAYEAARLERIEGRRRLAAASVLDRHAQLLRDYEAWARSRGLLRAANAGLGTAAARLDEHVELLRYGRPTP